MIRESENKSNLKFQSLKITGQSSLSGKINISGAKNSALVLLAASLLTKEKVFIDNIPELTDVQKMKNILKSLGVELLGNKSTLIINSKDLQACELPYELVNSLRASFFCIGPLLARLGEASLALPGGCKIGKRPIHEHIKGLRALGAKIHIKEGFVKAKINTKNKRLTGSNIELDCPSVGATETLVMAATLAEGKTTIRNAAREPEIQDLCQMLNKMGAKIEGAGESQIIINGVEELKGCSHKVIPDRIEAGTFLIAAAATLSSVTISPVIPKHLESVLNKLRESGSELKIKNTSISIKTKSIKSTNIETAPFPGFPTDLQAPFTALMAIADGESKITETIFEKRMSHINLLNKMGASIRTEHNIAFIKGVKELNGAKLLGSDLRSTAAIIIAALTANSESIIGGLEHLDRGYDNFESKLNTLGANITREADNNNFFLETKLIMKSSNNSSKVYKAA
ncbi:MAG: UDP-N-acetylglucosamine 1-carboxyvinyltransferase [Prochlorococcus sp. SP3034]|nr:UDP-N-acetylglucosamine 1-carboxyvinyltransferase [Prochlorococcus sp. SP3034]|tara:strand:+ start:3687 stop:5060 length:1374 start_codon:yes stop_codon:yes gene_type:complete